MKKSDILQIISAAGMGSKLRVEFNIGSSGTYGAVEGYLEQDGLMFSSNAPAIDLSFKDREINGYVWSYPEDIVDIKSITLI